jgi:transcriptional regulator with XRE-family HTH domain
MAATPIAAASKADVDRDLDRQVHQLVAGNVRRARHEAGLSQERLGELIGGVAHNDVCRWERKAEHGISPHNLVRIAAATGKPLHWFYMDHPDDE